MLPVTHVQGHSLQAESTFILKIFSFFCNFRLYRKLSCQVTLIRFDRIWRKYVQYCRSGLWWMAVQHWWNTECYGNRKEDNQVFQEGSVTLKDDSKYPSVGWSKMDCQVQYCVCFRGTSPESLVVWKCWARQGMVIARSNSRLVKYSMQQRSQICCKEWMRTYWKRLAT